jgi:hypothetical protein
LANDIITGSDNVFITVAISDADLLGGYRPPGPCEGAHHFYRPRIAAGDPRSHSPIRPASGGTHRLSSLQDKLAFLGRNRRSRDRLFSPKVETIALE